MKKSPRPIALPHAAELAALDREPIVIPGARGKAIMLLVGCLVFTLLGLVAISRGEDDMLTMGLPAAIIFGLGAIIAIVQIMRPPIMTLTMDGVTVKTIVRSWTVRWDQVDEFFVHKAQKVSQPAGFAMSSTEMAAFNWAVPQTVRKRGLFASKKVADGGFGPGWSLSAADLVTLLNAARTRALYEDTSEEPKTETGSATALREETP